PTNTSPLPASLAGIANGTSLYLRQLNDSAGNPTGVELFSDAAGKQPLVLSAAAASPDPAYFQVRVSQSQGSVAIQGLTPGEQFQLHALGNDLYQVAMDSLQYNTSQPYALRGQQITAVTQLQKASDPASSTSLQDSNTSTPGITLTTSIDAKDKAKSSGGTGSNPKLRDYASNPWLGLNQAKGFSGKRGDAFLGTKFKDAVKAGGGFDSKKGEVDDTGSVSGSVAVNIVTHTAKVTLGAGAILTSSGQIAISNTTKTLLNTWSEASTDLDNNTLGVLSVGVAVNTVDNTAESDLKGTIQAAEGSALPDVKITNTIDYPSLFFDTFGSREKIGKFFSNPANAVGTISNVSGTLMQNGFNSFATIKNKGKASKVGKDQQDAGTSLAVAISVNYSQVTNTARTILAGAIKANNLSHASVVDNSLVLGAGMLHQDFGLDRLFSGFLGATSENADRTNRWNRFWNNTKTGQSKRDKEGWGAAWQEFLSWGNVGKNGIGASLQLLQIANTAKLEIKGSANIRLSGKLSATNNQNPLELKENGTDQKNGTNQLVSLAVGGGSSENFGLTGSVSVTFGDGNDTGTSVDRGAIIKAASASLVALDNSDKVDIAGALQYSTAVGISTSLIINQLRRKTRNSLNSLLQLSSDELDNFVLDATNDGSITAISAAGTFMRTAGKGDDKVKFSDDNLSAQTSNSVSYWNGQITSFGLAGAGSVNVQQLANTAENSIDAGNAVVDASAGAYRISASAADRTKLQNWSGAFGYGGGGATQPTAGSAAANAGNRQEDSGQFTIAGAATVNQVSRQVGNKLSNTDFGGKALSYSAKASTSDAEATAGAISLAIGVNKAKTLVIPGSLAFNLDNPPGSDGNAVTSTVSKITGTNLASLQLTATNGADATAIAGSLGLAINPLKLIPEGGQASTSSSVAATLGFSVAINDLSTSTTAELADSTLTYEASTAPSISLTATSQDLDLTAVSIAASGSGTGGSSQSNLGSYAIAGSGAGAQNTFTNPIKARIASSTIAPTTGEATDPGRATVTLEASSDEQILSVTGGLDVAMAFAAQERSPTAALSVAASASYNQLSGAITAQIDPTSRITAEDLSLNATDNSQIGAYAIAGALSVTASKLSSSFGGAFVGAGTGNTIDRPLWAVIGDPDASTPGSGVVRTTSTTLKAERGTQSRIIADAAGAALTFVSAGTGSKSIGASFAGGFAFNELKGGITAGIYNITEYSSSGATAITATGRKADPYLLADGSIASFAGGFAVSVDLGSTGGQAMAAGGALGLAVSANTIDDAVTAKIANLRLADSGTLKLGSLAIEAKDERQLNTQATGDSLTVSRTEGTGGTAVAVGVGAASSRNTMEAAVTAAVELGSDQVLDVANDLTVEAQSLAQIEAFALAVALSFADGSSGVALAGGGAGSTNTITAPVTARVKAGTVKGGTNKAAQTTIKADSGETNAQGAVTNSRELVARLGAGSLAVARGRSATSFGASIGAVDVDNTLEGAVTAELQADNVDLPGVLDISSVSADKVDTTVAAASMAVGVSQTNATGVAIALSGAGAGARNTLAAASSATVVRFSDALSDATGALTVGGALNLTSTSTGTIEANVGSGSLAVSYAGNDNASLSLAPAVGVAVATNTLKGDSNAAVKGFDSVTVGGDLSLSSTSTRTIDSTSVAVAIGVAIGSKFSLGLAGGGANALNTITGGSQALLWADTIQADPGTISLSGTSSDTITAQV
ncbi:MAG: hypothetical protein WCH37_01960, partial [Synechococcaceae cyanobacterium ELA182]